MNDRDEQAVADAAILLAAVRSLDISQQLGFVLGTLTSTADMMGHVVREHAELIADDDVLGLLSSTSLTASLAVEALESAFEKARSSEVVHTRPPEWFLTLLERAVSHAQQ